MAGALVIEFADILIDIDLTQPAVLVKGTIAFDISGLVSIKETARKEILASIQPTAQSFDNSPSGERSRDGIDVWTSEPLTLAAGQRAADVIEWDGNQYRVTSVQAWQPYGNFYRAFAEKVQP